MDGARAMVERGDFLVPYFQGQPFFDKPILTYWLIAFPFAVLGPGFTAARLFAAAAALLTVWVTVSLGRRLFGEKAALAAGLVLTTTLTFVTFGRLAMSDGLLTLFTTLAVLLGLRLLDTRSSRTALALGTVLGLGFATKGPVAWLMAGIPLLLAWWPRRREGGPARPSALALAALLCLAISGAWFLLVYGRLGGEPLRYFFLKENLERFAGPAYDVGRPFWYYPPAYLLTGLPWSLVLVPALRDVRRSDPSWWLALWVALALVPLSLSRGKLDYYLLPLYPALTLLIGRWLTQEAWGAFDRAFARIALAAAGLGFAAAAFLPARFDTAWLPSPSVCVLFQVVAVLGALLAFAAAVRPSGRLTSVALAAPPLALGWLLGAAFLPAFRVGQPNQQIAEDVARERAFRREAQVVACADPARVERDILFEARVAVERRCDLWDVAPSREPYLFLLRPEEHLSLSRLPGFREVARYRYLPAATLTLSGLLAPREPQLVILAANFATDDPVAERRRRKLRKQELREEWERN
jgi:4-amino-4-deoxy-L-arabinose transferase-like glycosyltransferase